MATSTFADYLEKIKLQTAQISAKELGALSPEKAALVIDIRDVDEVSQGIIPQAVTVSRGFLEFNIEQLASAHAQPIVIYCASGSRSVLAADSLKTMGYTDVKSLVGGFKAWKDAGLKIELPSNLSSTDRSRYQAQIRMRQIGQLGQEKIKNSKVLIVGAGGLGSSAAFYLAAAGVGTLGIADDDVVDMTNLQRQILHTTDRVGLSKVESAYLTLKNLNPRIQVKMHKIRIDKTNIDSVFENYDIVVDGCDNFQTRYLINDACLKLNKVNIHGSIFEFTGQVSVFCAAGGPCYRCLYENPPPAELAPNCAEIGVLGVLPGSIGVLQATEALKLILQVGEALIGKLLVYDALSSKTNILNFRKNPDCPVCSKPTNQIQYQDEESFCASGAPD